MAHKKRKRRHPKKAKRRHHRKHKATPAQRAALRLLKRALGKKA